MSDKKPYKKQSQKPATPLTPEEFAALQAAKLKAQAEAKIERDRVEAFGRTLPSLSHGQLVKVLKKVIRKEYSGKPPVAQAGLTVGLGAILLTVLENTNTPENPFGKLNSYPR
jgi:hypothetical protein